MGSSAMGCPLTACSVLELDTGIQCLPDLAFHGLRRQAVTFHQERLIAAERAELILDPDAHKGAEVLAHQRLGNHAAEPAINRMLLERDDRFASPCQLTQRLRGERL